MVTLDIGLAPVLALLGGFLLTGQVSAESNPEDGPPKDFQRHLQAALTAQGWGVAAAADGGVCYRPPAGVVEGARVEARQADSLARELAARLGQEGWTARLAADGSVVYEPPGAATVHGEADSPPSSEPEPQEAPETTTTLAGQLQETLAQRGWVASTAPDGSVIYRPPSQVRPPAAPPPSPLAEQLRETLESRGWQAATGEDGAVYYRPPQPPAADSDTSQAVPQPPADHLRATLQERGWRAVPGAGGSTFYLPPAVAPQPQGSLAERLDAQLRQRGWKAFTAEDGSMIYLAPDDPASETAPGSAEEQPVREPPEQIPESLPTSEQESSPTGATPSAAVHDESESGTAPAHGDVTGVRLRYPAHRYPDYRYPGHRYPGWHPAPAPSQAPGRGWLAPRW